MLDALRKRTAFVDAAAARAGLANVSTVWARAEDAGHSAGLRQVWVVAFDLGVACFGQSFWRPRAWILPGPE